MNARLMIIIFNFIIVSLFLMRFTLNKREYLRVGCVWSDVFRSTYLSARDRDSHEERSLRKPTTAPCFLRCCYRLPLSLRSVLYLPVNYNNLIIRGVSLVPGYFFFK